MKVVFLSSFYPRRYKDQYLKESRAGLSAASDAHQYALALGLNKYCDSFEIINIPAVFPFPLRNKKMFVKKEIVEENGLRIRILPGCNLYGIQPLVRYREAKKAIKEIAKSTDDIVYVVVYETTSYALRCATECKNEHQNIRISVIIPDLPIFMDTKFVRLVNKLFFKSFQTYICQFDSYVLLTKSMKDIVGCEKKKYIVSEGVYDETITPRYEHNQKSNSFIIVYTGMLHKKYGALNLVNAVHQLKDEQMELRLCGYGDAVPEIKAISIIDKRIKYVGVVSREMALLEQSNASLLVNPRTPDDNPFTKYSFPSKTLEYFASGTPTLLYKLEGIPEEYYNYCYAIEPENTDVEYLSRRIKEIKDIGQTENNQLGHRARQFVLENKNSTVMAKKIIELLQQTL